MVTGPQIVAGIGVLALFGMLNGGGGPLSAAVAVLIILAGVGWSFYRGYSEEPQDEAETTDA